MLKNIGRGGYDDVDGVIIGGDWVTWELYYDNRRQGGYEVADTDEEAIAAATARCKALKAEWRPLGLYPDDSKWEVRIS